jgi:hypothetical protein
LRSRHWSSSVVVVHQGASCLCGTTVANMAASSCACVILFNVLTPCRRAGARTRQACGRLCARSWSQEEVDTLVVALKDVTQEAGSEFTYIKVSERFSECTLLPPPVPSSAAIVAMVTPCHEHLPLLRAAPPQHHASRILLWSGAGVTCARAHPPLPAGRGALTGTPCWVRRVHRLLREPLCGLNASPHADAGIHQASTPSSVSLKSPPPSA